MPLLIRFLCLFLFIFGFSISWFVLNDPNKMRGDFNRISNIYLVFFLEKEQLNSTAWNECGPKVHTCSRINSITVTISAV